VYELGDRFGIERSAASSAGTACRCVALVSLLNSDDAIHLYNLGWSLARVGDHLGVNHTTVLNKLRERGIPPATHTDDLGLDVLAILRRTVKRQYFESIPNEFTTLTPHGKGSEV